MLDYEFKSCGNNPIPDLDDLTRSFCNCSTSNQPAVPPGWMASNLKARSSKNQDTILIFDTVIGDQPTRDTIPFKTRRVISNLIYCNR